MKKLFYFSFVVLFVFQHAGAQQTGSVLFSIPGNMAFTMVLQPGKTVNSQPARNLFITKIPVGVQTADFTVLRPGIADLKFNYSFSVEAGKESQFYVQGQGNSFSLLLDETVAESPGGHNDMMSFECKPVASKVPNSFFIAAVQNAFNPLADSWTPAKGWASLAPPVITSPVPNPTPNNTVPNTNGKIMTAPCFPPVTNDVFLVSFNRVKNKSGESAKLAIAKDILEQACFTSDQILQFMNQIMYEDNKIDLGKTGWHHCSDPLNWSIVYDAFEYGNNIETLKAYVKANPYSSMGGSANVPVPNPAPVNIPPPVPNPVVVKPPVIVAPPVRYYESAVPGYTGQIGCEWPVDDATFNAQKESIKSKGFSSTQMTVMKQIVPKECLTVNQIKDLIKVFSFDSDQIEVAKYCWNYVYDMDNYYLVNDVFGFSSSIDELDVYLKANPKKGIGRIGGVIGGAAVPPGNKSQTSIAAAAPVVMVPMDDVSFKALKASMQKQYSGPNQLAVMNQGLDGKYLTTAQVKSLMSFFYGETEKLATAKTGWLKCTDPANFFTVNDLFFMSTSIKELDAYRKANPR